MSATKIIERIKTLPEQDRREVIDYVKKNLAPSVDARATRRERFEQAADAVFRKHDEALRRLAQ